MTYDPVDEAMVRLSVLMALPGDLVRRRAALTSLYDGLGAATTLPDDELGCSRGALALMTSALRAYLDAADLYAAGVTTDEQAAEILRLFDAGTEYLQAAADVEATSAT